VCRPCTCLLHLSTPLFVFTPLVVEVVGVTDERDTRSDGEVSIHVQVDIEYRSVLRRPALCPSLSRQQCGGSSRRLPEEDVNKNDLFS
jgi:hypothetical protein